MVPNTGRPLREAPAVTRWSVIYRVIDVFWRITNEPSRVPDLTGLRQTERVGSVLVTAFVRKVVDDTFGTVTNRSCFSSPLRLGYSGVLSERKEAEFNHRLLFIGRSHHCRLLIGQQSRHTWQYLPSMPAVVSNKASLCVLTNIHKTRRKNPRCPPSYSSVYRRTLNMTSCYVMLRVCADAALSVRLNPVKPNCVWQNENPTFWSYDGPKTFVRNCC